eukprot:1768252-Amphidinium_carterae.1
MRQRIRSIESEETTFSGSAYVSYSCQAYVPSKMVGLGCNGTGKLIACVAPIQVLERVWQQEQQLGVNE